MHLEFGCAAFFISRYFHDVLVSICSTGVEGRVVIAGTCGGSRWADPILERGARHGSVGSVSCDRGPLPAPLCHCTAGGE